MTKSLFVLLAVLLSTSVLAEDKNSAVGVSYAFRDTVSSNQGQPNRQGINLTYMQKLGPALTWDLNQQFRTEQLNTDNGNSTTRLETGLSYAYGLFEDVAVYTRGGLGYKFQDGADYAYYSIEPGVKVALTSKLVGRVGYRFRDSFSSSYLEQTNTARIGAEYSLNDTSVITLGIDRSYKDSEFIGYNAGYVYKF